MGRASLSTWARAATAAAPGGGPPWAAEVGVLRAPVAAAAAPLGRADEAAASLVAYNQLFFFWGGVKKRKLAKKIYFRDKNTFIFAILLTFPLPLSFRLLLLPSLAGFFPCEIKFVAVHLNNKFVESRTFPFLFRLPVPPLLLEASRLALSAGSVRRSCVALSMAGRAADSAGAPASKPRLKSCRAAVRSLQEKEEPPH